MMASGDNLTAVIPLNVVEPFNGESNLKLIKLEVALVRESKLKQQQMRVINNSVRDLDCIDCSCELDHTDVDVCD